MKMKLVLLSFLFVTAALHSGCMNHFNSFPCTEGSGTVKKVKMEVSDFQKLTLDGAYGVYIRQDSVQSIILETDDNLVSNVKFESIGEGLRIKSKGSICPSKMNLYISSPNLTDIVINGSADLNGKGAISYKYLDISVNGSGDVRFDNLTTQTLKARVAGSGDFYFAGFTNNVDFEIDGAGDIHADNFRSNYCEATVAGAGDITVWADSSLRATIHGAGDIIYYGSPRMLRTSVHGAGDVTQKTK